MVFNGCYFMTATTAPRLQVDNGIKMSTTTGCFTSRRCLTAIFQDDWKPESPDKNGDIDELIKAIGTLRVEETKPQGEKSKASQTYAKSTSTNPPAAKPAAYRPRMPRLQLLFKLSYFRTMSKNALKIKKKREKQKEKKAAAAASGS